MLLNNVRRRINWLIIESLYFIRIGYTSPIIFDVDITNFDLLILFGLQKYLKKTGASYFLYFVYNIEK